MRNPLAFLSVVLLSIATSAFAAVETVEPKDFAHAAHGAPAFVMRLESQYWDPKEKNTVSNHGTAWAIDVRHAVTNAHLVYVSDLKALSTDILVETATKWVKCRVLKYDRSQDIALLEALDDLPTPVEFGDDPSGDVSAVGWALTQGEWSHGTPLIVMNGSVTEQSPDGQSPARWQAKMPGFGHGCSGGPVLKDGKLAGLMVGGIAANDDGYTMVGGVMLFLPVSSIKEFLGMH